jgi:hypothetical protein
LINATTRLMIWREHRLGIEPRAQVKAHTAAPG